MTPAELTGGTTSHFKDIKGVADTGDTVTSQHELQQRQLPLQHDGDDGGLVQRLAGGDLHLLPPGDVSYNAAANPLPNAHTKHVDEVADGGYNYACTNCHLDNGTNMAHQDGDVAGDVLFTARCRPGATTATRRSAAPATAW